MGTVAGSAVHAGLGLAAAPASDRNVAPGSRRQTCYARDSLGAARDTDRSER